MSASRTKYVTGRHYQTRRCVQLEISDGKIRGVRDLTGDARAPRNLNWIAPGFIDIQSNGYGGQEFSSLALSVEHVAEIVGKQASFGVTQFCPTVTTAGFETLAHGLRTIDQACRRWPVVAYAVAGIHLEGPYISREDGPRGAHPTAHCRPPDWEEFQRLQEAAGGRIRILTLSPEYPEAAGFITRAVAGGVVVAIGHTTADSAQIRAAVDAGATLSTHLGNGAHRTLRRHPNYIWDQMAEDRLMASLIVDGHHLPGEVVQSLLRAKTPERCILVSDLSGLAGLPPGRYATHLCELEILADGRLVIAGQDQLLAGASQPISVSVGNVMRYAGVDLPTAVQMASHHPARLLGLGEVRLLPGDAADLTLFDLHTSSDDRVTWLEITSTVAGGRLLLFAQQPFRRPAGPAG
jgi:N-acetylglucosamine-6-phosphate deacetylase